MRPVTLCFLLAEGLDILTTLWGLSLGKGLYEGNRLLAFPYLMVFKLVGVLGIAVVLEKKKHWSRSVWVVPGVAVLPGLWNAFLIGVIGL